MAFITADGRSFIEPQPVPETEAFWTAAKDGRFLVKRCRACGKAHWYPRSRCPFCAGTDTEWIGGSGRGTIYSYSVMRRAAVPYVMAYVTLAEGPTMMTNIIDCDPERLRIGDAVLVAFVATPGGMALPMFRPEPAHAGGEGLSMAGVSKVAAMMGVGHSDWIADHARTRKGEKPHNSFGYGAVAFRRALADAGIEASEIDGLVSGPPTAHERMSEILGIDPRWGVQTDAMMGIQEACLAINGGMCEVVALVYGNDQRSASVNYGGTNAAGGAAFLSYVYHAPWGFTSQGALYAIMLRRFMHETGFTERDLGAVAVAQRLHSSLNPHAVMQERITIEDYLASHYVTEPLHLFDYCLINDGGVAFVLMSAERAERQARKTGRKPVYVHGIGRADLSKGATSLEPRLTNFYRPAQQKVAAQVFAMAGVGPQDISALQVYDSFSVHIPLALEGYGYCGLGEAQKFFRDTGISLERGLPVNTSGGHLSESYMQGWNHQVEAVRQLRGECGPRQVPGCRFVHYSSDVAGKALSIIYGL